MMTAGGSLKGVLLLDENVPRDAVQLMLEPHPLHEPDQNDSGSSFVAVKSNGDFVSHGLPLGTVDLVVRCENTSEELFRVDGLPVSTDTSAPHDAGVIDLRGMLTSFTVKFVDSEDKRIDQVQVSSEEGKQYGWLWREDYVVVTTKASVSLRASSDGYREAVLNNISEDTTVVMKDGIKVRIRISNPGLIPVDFLAGLSLRNAEENTTTSHMIGGEMDILNSNFEQVLLAAKPGTFNVQIHLAQKSSMNTTGWWSVAAPPGSSTIEVLDVPGEQLFVVTLDADNVDDILARFQQ
jgi:hypothetical protein